MSFIPLPNPLPTTDVPTGGVSFRRYSRNSAAGASYAMIDTTGSASPNYRTAAAKVEIRSTSTSDTFLGLGARAVLLTGLDASFNLLTETLNLNGVTVVSSVNSFIRLNGVEVTSVGTYGGLPGVSIDGANLGTITSNFQGSATVVNTIRIQDGHEFSAAYCVPRGYYLGISTIVSSVDTNKSCDLVVRFRTSADDITSPFKSTLLGAELIGVATGSISSYSPALILPEMSDLYFMGKASTGTASITFSLVGYLAPNA